MKIFLLFLAMLGMVNAVPTDGEVSISITFLPNATCAAEDPCFNLVLNVLDAELTLSGSVPQYTPVAGTTVVTLANGGTRRGLRGEERELFGSCSQCAQVAGWWTCRAMGYCRRRRELTTATTLVNAGELDTSLEPCWEPAHHTLKNKVQAIINAIAPNSFTVEVDTFNSNAPGCPL